MIRLPPSHKTRSEQAFTLVEMLAVLAITAIMSVIAVPVIGSLRGAAVLDRSAHDLAFFIEQSRAHALASSTHVWIGFGRNGEGHPVAFAFASRDRTSDITNASNLRQLGSQLVLRDAQFSDLSAFDFGERRDDSGVAHLWGEGATELAALAIPLTPAVLTTGTALQITPTGEISLRHENGLEQSFRWLEIGITIARPSGVEAAPDAAALQLAGLTGRVIVYRP